jgi:hypothetical protein
MAKPKGKDYRAAVREAIKKDGLGKTAERVGVQEDTLQRYAFGAARSHKGTIALVEKAFA